MSCIRIRFLEAFPAVLGLALAGTTGCSAASAAEPPEIGRSVRQPMPGDGVAVLAAGHSGYGGETVRKGAKRIEFDLASGEWTQVTVFPDGTRWRPS